MPAKKREKQKIDRTPLPVETVNIGEIIDSSLKVFVKDIKDYFLLTVVVYSPIIFLQVILVMLVILFLQIDQNPELIQGCANIFISIFALFSWVILVGAATILTIDIYEGKNTTFMEALKRTPQFIVPIISVTMLTGIGMMAASLIFILIAVAFYYVFRFEPIFAVTITSLFSMVGLVILTYLVFSLKLAPFLVIIEGATPIEALQRSMKLFFANKDTQLKIFAVPFLFQLLAVAFLWIPFVGLFAIALEAISMVMIYYDVRIRTEGYDMELEAERLKKRLHMENKSPDMVYTPEPD
ncbi:MAG: hypothetical protein ACLFQV_06440 [Vulcanimicrobiota bacterium]